MKTILFLASNPANTGQLQLDEEIRAIDSRLQRSKFRDRFELKQQWALRIEDLQEALLRFNPHIVHFSGHGNQSGELIFKDSIGKAQTVSKSALSQLFNILKDNISCVVLNACFSQSQAEGIAESIDCVVGMSRAITDSAAISFASSFYQALGYGRSIKNAFELGRSQINLEGFTEENTPKLLARLVNPDVVFPGLDPTPNRNIRFRSSGLVPDFSETKTNVKDLFVVSERVFPHPLNDEEKQSQKIEFILRMKETDKEIRVIAPAFAPIGAVAEFLIQELFPHVDHLRYDWTLVHGNNRLSARHTFVTAGIVENDVLTIFGEPIQMDFWAPNMTFKPMNRFSRGSKPKDK